LTAKEKSEVRCQSGKRVEKSDQQVNLKGDKGGRDLHAEGITNEGYATAQGDINASTH